MIASRIKVCQSRSPLQLHSDLYSTVVASLSVQVVAAWEGPNLAGRDWLDKLKVTCGQVNLVEHKKLKEC